MEVSPHELEKAALRAQRDFVYERSLGLLQIELVKMAEWVRASGSKLVVIFEGRDAAGKGGVISRISSAISPRILRVVAPGTPSDREKTQWCSHPLLPPRRAAYMIVSSASVDKLHVRAATPTFACTLWTGTTSASCHISQQPERSSFLIGRGTAELEWSE